MCKYSPLKVEFENYFHLYVTKKISVIITVVRYLQKPNKTNDYRSFRRTRLSSITRLTSILSELFHF